MYKRFVFVVSFALGAFFLSTCSSSQDWRLISEDEVRLLLPHYVMLSARLQNNGDPDSVRLSVYQQYFAERGYRLVDWDSSMMYYAKHNMPLYHDFYRLASDSLMLLSERLQRKYDERTKYEENENKLKGYTLDSVNLLKIPSAVYYKGELINRYFNITPSQPYTDSEGELSVRIRGILKRLPADKLLRLELAFYSQDSSRQVKTLMIDRSGDYKLSLRTSTDKPVIHVSGYLRGLNSCDMMWVDSLYFLRRPKSQSIDEDNNVDNETIDGALVTVENPDADKF